MSRAKPCATCGHPKSRHRTRECRHTWQTRGATFMGIRTVTRWCPCPGYVTLTLTRTGGHYLAECETRPGRSQP